MALQALFVTEINDSSNARTGRARPTRTGETCCDNRIGSEKQSNHRSRLCPALVGRPRKGGVPSPAHRPRAYIILHKYILTGYISIKWRQGAFIFPELFRLDRLDGRFAARWTVETWSHNSRDWAFYLPPIYHSIYFLHYLNY